MFCSRCGANVADGTVFCPQCGLPVVTARSAQPPAPPQSDAPPSSAPPAGLVPPPPPPPPAPPAYTPPYAPPAQPQYPPQQYAAAVPTPQVAYAGFWLRVVATLIDGFIIGIPFIVLFFLMFASAFPDMMRNQGDPSMLVLTFLPRFMLLALIAIIGSWLYWAKCESSSWQATLGKKALGLYVTNLEGRPVSFGQASGRFWAGRGLQLVPYLGGLYFLIDCICAGLTERKQAIHDMIASCLVLRKV